MLAVKSTIPAHEEHTASCQKGSDCPLTLSELVTEKGLSVEALESRQTNIGVTRINFLFTTYCI